MKTKEVIYYEDIIKTNEFTNLSNDSFVLGKIIKEKTELSYFDDENTDKYKVLSLSKIVNLLVVGMSGTGKSTILHNLLVSLLEKNSPKDLKLVLADLKMVEFNLYKDLPHLLKNPITEPKDLLEILRELNCEVNNRYEKLTKKDCYTLKDYNSYVAEEEKLPQIVVVIDEYLEMIYSYGYEFENLIISLLQKGRAVGIHLVMASQRAENEFNFQTVIALKTCSQNDSYNLLRCKGAEELDFHGELLIKEPYLKELTKVQSVYISTKDINEKVAKLKK